MAKHKEVAEYREFTGRAEYDKALNGFIGLLEGILIDNVVDSDEYREVKNWYELNRHLIDRPPFNEIIPAIDSVMADEVLTEDEVQDLLWLCRQASSPLYYNLVTGAIQNLHGVIHGVLANNALSDEEIRALENWMEDHSVLKGTYPFDEIYSLVSSVLEDGVVTDRERSVLKAYFSEFVDTTESYNLNELELKQLREEYSVDGICAKDPVVIVPEHNFCFTGASSRATRNQIAEEVTDHGGRFADSVTKKTEYLVVGAEGNPCWAFSCYGRKVEKAVALRKEGRPIQIINELDFWKTIDE